ncbi:hypothetical protein K435DRAFT_862640 [Dendrothele bispora CBS 962.96]|uniref:Uncharacterized protein n=1 Tax=Dendrothele bispora (strain CBS 962.96) TaxID=1314807 RepID=A0A4S8LS20_DENBC|nr:hypothetical protein K435DRAFT_862640 [Dendrothele bispora CBS 962.96]
MVYRIPTHLETFVPPPAPPVPSNSQSALTHPWRGRFIVSGMRASDIGNSQEIGVTAVETDGETSSHLWPPSLMFTIAKPHALPILKQLQEFIKAAAAQGRPVPLSTFMPERLRDPNANTVNQSMFRSLSRVLWDDQNVAVVPFSTPSPRVSSPQTHNPSANRSMGILIYPASNSSAILIGAIFLDPSQGFPDFVNAAQRQHHHQSHPSPPSLSPHQVQSTQTSMQSQQPSQGGGGYPHSTYSTMSSGSRGRDEVPISPTVINSRSNIQRQQFTSSFSSPSTSSRQRSASESFRHSSPYGLVARQSQSLSPTSENAGEAVDIRQQFPPQIMPNPLTRLTPGAPGSGGEHHHHHYHHPAAFRSMTPGSTIPGLSAQSHAGYASSAERFTSESAGGGGQYVAHMNTPSSESASSSGGQYPEGRSPRQYGTTQGTYPTGGRGSGSTSQSHSLYGP